MQDYGRRQKKITSAFIAWTFAIVKLYRSVSFGSLRMEIVWRDSSRERERELFSSSHTRLLPGLNDERACERVKPIAEDGKKRKLHANFGRRSKVVVVRAKEKEWPSTQGRKYQVGFVVVAMVIIAHYRNAVEKEHWPNPTGPPSLINSRAIVYDEAPPRVIIARE